MVHAFTLGGIHLVLDVCSGSLHMLDPLSYAVVTRYETMARDEIVKDLAPHYSAVEVDEALEEIEALQAQGALFSEWTEQDVSLNPQGEVKALCLNIAHDCNLRCRYCFAGTGAFHGPRGLMSEETGKAALDFLFSRSGSRRFLEVDFFGGEPLINFDVLQAIVAHGRALEKQYGKTLRFTTTTNGVLLTDDIAAYLDREMANVVISIDGRPHVHDAMRPDAGGKGSYDRIIDNARHFVARRDGRDYYIRGTYTNRNLDFADDVLWLADQGFQEISVEPVVLPENADIALRAEHLPAIKAEYERLATLFKERREQGQGFHFFHFMVDLNQGPCAVKRLTGCGAGNEYLAVAPDGGLYPCHQFVGEERWRLGDVFRGIEREELRALFRGNTALGKPECSACWARFHCGGGCAANAFHFNGDIGKPYAVECEIERKRVECALYLEAVRRLGGG